MAKLIQYPCAGSFYDGPFDSKAGWRAASMGYAIRTENGHLVVIDGGDSNDAEGFLALLEELSGGKKPVVDLWLITHPHGDHYYALRSIALNPAMASRLSVKTIVYHFSEDFCASEEHPSPCVGLNQDMERIATAVGARTHTPHRDERFVVDDVEVRILYTPDDCSIYRVAELNYLSLIFTVQGKTHRALFTGDAGRPSMEITRWRYSHVDLESQYLQLPHHGLCDVGCLNFYKGVNAKVILHPSCISGDRSMATIYRDDPHAIENRWACENAERVCYAYDGRIELEL